MAKDYSGNIASAQAKIVNFGRAVTFVQFDSTPDDPAEPWNARTDVRTTPDSTLATSAVFVQPSSQNLLGLGKMTDDGLLKRSEQIMIVAPGATDDLDDYQEVIDTDTTTWKVVGVEVLKPGPDVVLAFVGVKR